VAHAVGAVVDRVNLLPVRHLAPLDPLLSTVGLSGSADSLLAMAGTLHGKLMGILGLDAGAAWHALGIIPVLGANDLLGGALPLDTARKVAEFAKANGLGLLGLLPLGTGKACESGGGLPLLGSLLGCLGGNALPRFLAVTDVVNRVLR